MAVTNKLHAMQLVDYDDTVLFAEAVRTTEEHSSNSIEIHKIEGLRNLPLPMDQISGENGYDL